MPGVAPYAVPACRVGTRRPTRRPSPSPARSPVDWPTRSQSRHPPSGPDQPQRPRSSHLRPARGDARVKLQPMAFLQAKRLLAHRNVSAYLSLIALRTRGRPASPARNRRSLLPCLARLCFTPRFPAAAEASRAAMPICARRHPAGARAETARGRITCRFMNACSSHATTSRSSRSRPSPTRSPPTVTERRRRGQEARILGPARPRLPHQEEPQGALHAPRHRRDAGRDAGGASASSA